MVIRELKSPASCFSHTARVNQRPQRHLQHPQAPSLRRLAPVWVLYLLVCKPGIPSGTNALKCWLPHYVPMVRKTDNDKHLTPTQKYWHISFWCSLLWMFTICFSFLLDDFKDYGANCEGMAAEIEDHILCGHYWLTVTCFVKMSIESSWSHC